METGALTGILLGGLAVLLWIQAAWFLSTRIHRWREGGRRRPWLQSVSVALRNACVWAGSVVAAFVIVAVNVSVGDDQGLAAMAAVLLFGGGTALGFHGGVLALGTFLGFVYLRPDAPHARPARCGALAGVIATLPAIALMLLVENGRPTLAQAGFLLGLYLYDAALAAVVYSRLARPAAPHTREAA